MYLKRKALLNQEINKARSWCIIKLTDKISLVQEMNPIESVILKNHIYPPFPQNHFVAIFIVFVLNRMAS